MQNRRGVRGECGQGTMVGHLQLLLSRNTMTDRSSLSFIRRHLVSDREKPLNTLSIHTFHPGLPGRYSWPLIRSAFCNYSTHLLSGVRGVQLVQALLALPCSSFVTARPLLHFYLTTLSSPASPLFRVFVLYTIIATFYLPTILNGPVFGFGPTARERSTPWQIVIMECSEFL